ncbi:MAG: hypothetical protein LBG58_14455 [Planctomycetaceae bacterium]|jgi:hypothetical protein|nr:hypothetical protein [Planctomycetaceae bacterium]
MPSHFSSIGMPVKTEKEFFELVKRASNLGNKISCEHGYYSQWHSQTGAELWIQLDNTSTIFGGNPFYDGSSEFSAGIIHKVERKGDNVLAGTFYAWANPRDHEPENGDYPFVFECVNVAEIKKLELPCIKKVKLTAFTHDIDIYASSDDYHSKQERTPHFGTQFFSPSGTFRPDNHPSDETFEMTPEAMFIGIILDYKKYTNELTNEDFYWIKVDTFGGIIDTVVDPVFIKSDLKINGVIAGVFYLCGKIIAE